ncbi:MAG: PEP-CTERM sorting domain-containing protein [Burkholderiales bacterium]|nr:PEP-CTERM sorting domain-containing protein [Burkholderiales bacterium]
MKSTIRNTFTAVAGAALMAISGTASAAFIATIEGNDCAGVFGQGFANCAIPEQYDPDRSPVIIKFAYLGDGVFEVDEEDGEAAINPLFPTIDGTEFSFVTSGDGETGEWVYEKNDLDDPDITFFVAKGGDFFNLFDVFGSSGEWNTPLNPANGQLFELSHLTFYDTGGGPPTEIPEPGMLLLLGSALAALGLRRRLRA